MGYRTEYGAIMKQHGGLYKVFSKLGYEPSKKPAKYWKVFTNVENHLKPILEDFIKNKGRLPSWDELSNINSSLTSAFTYHGGIRQVLQKMGYIPIETNKDFEVFRSKYRSKICCKIRSN